MKGVVFRIRHWQKPCYVLHGMVLCIVWYWFSVILCKSLRVPHVGQEMLNISGMPDSLLLTGEFIISPFHYIYITEFVSFRTMFTD